MPELDVHHVFNGCSTIQLDVDRNTASTGKVHRAISTLKIRKSVGKDWLQARSGTVSLGQKLRPVLPFSARKRCSNTPQSFCLIFGYIVERTNTKIVWSHFLQFPS